MGLADAIPLRRPKQESASAGKRASDNGRGSSQLVFEPEEGS
jgi:hypothetical protein